jgi:hypothetical protein
MGIKSNDPLQLMDARRRRATDRVSPKALTARVDVSRWGRRKPMQPPVEEQRAILQKRTSAFNSPDHSSDEFLQRRFRQRHQFLRPM